MRVEVRAAGSSMACKGSGVQIPSAPPQVSGLIEPRPSSTSSTRAALRGTAGDSGVRIGQLDKAAGDRWQVDETYVKVAGRWRYVYRAIDQFGQVIDVFRSSQRDAKAARRFFEQAISTTRITSVEVVADKAATYPIVRDELLPAAWHRTDQYANNRVEADHGRLKARLRPMRGFKHDRSARIVIAGHALVQNVRRGHYELGVEASANRRVVVAFDELVLAI
jgi:transposase, IS6 family